MCIFFFREVAIGILILWSLLTLVCHVAFSIVAVMIYLEPVLVALRMGEAVVGSRKDLLVAQAAVGSNKSLFPRQIRKGEKTKDDEGGSEHTGKPCEPGFIARLVQRCRADSASVAHQSLKNKKERQLAGVVLIVLSSTALLMNVTAFLLFPDELENTWLDVYAVGFNLDSILFNLGFLIIFGGGTKRVSDIKQASDKKKAAVAAEVSFEANSQASSSCSPSEVGTEMGERFGSICKFPTIEAGNPV